MFVHIAGVADINPLRREGVAGRAGIWLEMCFESAKVLAREGRIADCIISGSNGSPTSVYAVPSAGYRPGCKAHSARPLIVSVT